ncbi:hypothetical protein [Actinopolyspora halophila]|uniref:hypothetical protein n=1 Tax=Actinopolyspora halophila TaxID=1850 RepID=UPI0003817857|nr:hypothetical protein [Actinopolyspora halophila]
MDIFPGRSDRAEEQLHPEVVEPTVEELAAAESPLPEWERLRVQRFYAEMIEQELGPDLPEDVPARRTASGAVLWLVPGEAGRCGDEFAGGEAA